MQDAIPSLTTKKPDVITTHMSRGLRPQILSVYQAVGYRSLGKSCLLEALYVQTVPRWAEYR
jgi:hypothetical protein